MESQQAPQINQPPVEAAGSSLDPDTPATEQLAETASKSNNSTQTNPSTVEAVLAWQEREVNDTTRTPLWYLLFALTVIILFIISIILFRSFTFAILIPVMSIALLVSLHRPAALISYSVGHTGVTVGNRSYLYDTFRSFSVTTKPTQNWLTLLPRKRFAMPIIIYFPHDLGEELVDTVAAHLPMSEPKTDILEQLVIFLRLQ